MNLNIYSSSYNNIVYIVLGDFDVEIDNNDMKDFFKNYILKVPIKVPTCCKNPSNFCVWIKN